MVEAPKRQQPCPCGSGRSFQECHGAAAEEIPLVVRPLHIHRLVLSDGREYKTVGTDPNATMQEGLKTKLWLERQ